MNITKFTADAQSAWFVTDTAPRFAYICDEEIRQAELTVDGRSFDATQHLGFSCEGLELQPHRDYTALLCVNGSMGKKLHFRSGKCHEPWVGAWITDGNYRFTEKKVSPKVMVFRKKLTFGKKIARAEIFATALGIYALTINGKAVGERYFAPGFTSYRSQLQYQTYDVTQMLTETSTLYAEVSGGWAVGSFVFTRANRITAPRQALRLELRVEYEDGSVETIGTDASWQVSLEGPVKLADLYDGEIYDARCELAELAYRPAALENVKIHPQLLADYGLPVVRREKMTPKLLGMVGKKAIYDFGQNFAGIVEFSLAGKAGQTITIRHAEILKEDGDLNTTFLRSAKATVTYVCKDGPQTYAPRFTYMGFRYISLEGIKPEEITLCAWALYSDLERTGTFSCSNEQLNRLNENILWSARSNFLEIPTDCPQRDERMGWTGDIAVFAPTAVYNFGMTRFLKKWLKDLRSEQLPTGGVPNTIPSQSYGFPTTMPTMAIDFWGDACILVPWAMYQAEGDPQILEEAYASMEKYVKASAFWAKIWGLGKQRYIWHTPSMLHFGDWIAPDVPKMSQWQGRSKWTATASLYHTASLLSEISGILGKQEKQRRYRALAEKVADAYASVLMNPDGSLKNEFQTGYVLPLHFGMLRGAQKEGAAKKLAQMVEKNNYCIGTGFPGTPYILFALADNGYADVAYRMLMNTRCPSWLHEVAAGGTTIWERWDGLDENGKCAIGDDGTGGMISYNHYASGAVGDFLYRRVAGIEAAEPGYRRFRIAPLVGGGLQWAEGSVQTPYGTLCAGWKLENDKLCVTVDVPAGTQGTVVLPGMETPVTPGKHSFQVPKA